MALIGKVHSFTYSDPAVRDIIYKGDINEQTELLSFCKESLIDSVEKEILRYENIVERSRKLLSLLSKEAQTMTNNDHFVKLSRMKLISEKKLQKLEAFMEVDKQMRPDIWDDLNF